MWNFLKIKSEINHTVGDIQPVPLKTSTTELCHQSASVTTIFHFLSWWCCWISSNRLLTTCSVGKANVSFAGFICLCAWLVCFFTCVNFTSRNGSTVKLLEQLHSNCSNCTKLVKLPLSQKLSAVHFHAITSVLTCSLQFPCSCSHVVSQCWATTLKLWWLCQNCSN